MKTKRYTVELKRDETGTWVAQLVEPSGVITQGRTIDEALRHVREALWAYTGDAKLARTAELVPKFIGLPKPLLAKVSAARAARERAEAEQERASTAIRRAAAALSRRGLSARDVGELLGVSRQRAHKLVSER